MTATKNERKIERVMTTTKNEKLELICWLIERNDQQRESVASRATFVVSADALFLGGVTFLLDNILAIQKTPLLQVILLVCICLTVLFLLSSIGFATIGIVNWKISSKAVMSDRHKRLFFRSHDTVVTFKNFAVYEEAFNKATPDQLISYSLNYLWTMQNLFRNRYQALQRAIIFLLLSIVPFTVSFAILLLFKI